MSVRYAVLGFLSSKDMHGYEIKSKFDLATGGFWQLNFGQIYSTLDRLDREGFVERVAEVDSESPDRKVFRITVRGRSGLDDWVKRPVAHPRPLRDDLLVRLLFCDRSSPEPVARMIARQRDVYELEMRKLTERKTDLCKLDLGKHAVVTDLLMDAALFHAEAELRWLSHVEQKLSRSWSQDPKKRKPG